VIFSAQDAEYENHKHHHKDRAQRSSDVQNLAPLKDAEQEHRARYKQQLDDDVDRHEHSAWSPEEQRARVHPTFGLSTSRRTEILLTALKAISMTDITSRMVMNSPAIRSSVPLNIGTFAAAPFEDPHLTIVGSMVISHEMQ
jgi:hypothetical protein